eukprot:CAMPEP_0183295712 /NCGR_PEP_ID=MMETSP0160_2-20130417/3570_1 /TAXON_ID=2839 ORGANISM="Odontella Sinensis, Strain Grunow 1884" /NCGR_SAMPLE_ID=MMETSP0160_2 /ASSEMBLY_ACC=CAM_ASM_000250 /LENGTH=139 /DNA_ID=CAMNT_0025457237 /DNA_START=103 /DNA_END=519 /DNA_ORIENTATION=+
MSVVAMADCLFPALTSFGALTASSSFPSRATIFVGSSSAPRDQEHALERHGFLILGVKVAASAGVGEAVGISGACNRSSSLLVPGAATPPKTSLPLLSHAALPLSESTLLSYIRITEVESFRPRHPTTKWILSGDSHRA